MNTSRILLAGVLAVMAVGARAETGVTDREVVLGQVAAFSGPAAQLGKGCAPAWRRTSRR